MLQIDYVAYFNLCIFTNDVLLRVTTTTKLSDAVCAQHYYLMPFISLLLDSE